MTLFEELVSKVKSNNEKVTNGEILMIDISSVFPRLAALLPGFVKGDQIIITANSGVGKSRFSRFMFVKLPIALSQVSKLKPKIFLNSLEETPEKVASTFVIQYLKENHDLVLSYYDLLYPRVPHDSAILSKIEEGWAYYKQIEKYLEVVSIHQPYGFYKHIRDYLATVGTFLLDGEPIKTIGQDKWNEYHYTDPNTFVIGISDNINNYHAEGSFTWYDTIKRFSSYYCRGLLCMKCGCIIVNIQQQASDKERIEARADTYLLEKKLEPSLDGLGDIKITQRDALIVLGLFDPSRYDMIEIHGGWDMRRMKSFYRSIHLLKHREGLNNKIIPCYADLSRDFFKELPPEISEVNYRNLGL